MMHTNQITFNLGSFPYAVSEVLRVVIVKASRVLSLRIALRGVKGQGLGLLRWVRGLRCGAFVRKFQVLTRALYIIREKMSAYRVAIGSSLAVLCQLAYTSLLLPMCWACTPNTLHVEQVYDYTIQRHIVKFSDPHPLNFGVRCNMHPTLTPTTFSPFKKHCLNGQHTNKDNA